MDHIKFLKRIGAKGGAARKTNPRRSELARAAAMKRWEKQKQQQPKENPQ